ncbi:MAG: hypothetical protein KDC87_12715 [Planctomycetes bacterium]|nr:hypothetical protein [Planctomycetota bacterium]
MTTNPDSDGSLTPATRMREAMARDPNLPVVLMRFHIGGCSMCGFDDDDTIAKVAEDNGVPVERLLAAMNHSTPNA